jgi:signal transduction histidine kinase/CheY-like chemotaxis protein
MEEELRKARDDLERRVQERTTELSRAKEHLEVINEKLLVEITKHEQLEKELIKTKEAAEAAVEAKAAFLANMSHELRTPMNAVIGFSSLLLDENLTPEQKDYVESIRNGGGALLSIISDILEFSRVEKERVKLEHQPFSLKHCIDESLDMIAIQAKQKGLNITHAISYDAPDTIIGDHDRLRQILTNLLSNAVKFTDEGEVSVSVSSKTIEGNKLQITFAVKDTGIGIPSDKMDRIFKPFTQLDYKISRKRGGGAGLGLAISKELVELMCGEIWVESEPERGSTFRFTILAEVFTGKYQDLKETSNDTAYKNLSEQNPLAIMVAEDSPINQRVIVKMLMKMGYRPDAVADGREVLQVLKIRHYDLILMDINMPEMDGITATMEIRKLWPATEQPHIVAVTAFAMESDRETCLEAGMNDYIAKPVLKKDLETILMKCSGVPI